MSNKDVKQQLFDNAYADYQKGMRQTHRLMKLVHSVKGVNEDEFWNVVWKDYKFSIKPYLCSALSFVIGGEATCILCDLVVQGEEDFYNTLLNYAPSDYHKTFTADENNVFDSICYHSNSYVPCIVRYLISRGNVTDIRKLMCLLLKDFIKLSSNPSGDYYVRFSDKSICNTQAFSYFISVYWLIQSVGKLRVLLGRELSSIKLTSILDDVCPEVSIHYQYLSGKITSTQLKDRYKPDIFYKELINLKDDSDNIVYSKEFNKVMDICNSSLMYNTYEYFCEIMACYYFQSDLYEKQQKKIQNMGVQLDESKTVVEKYKASNKEIKLQLRTVKKENEVLQSKCNQAQLSDRVERYKIKVHNLDMKLSACTSEIQRLKDELELKDKELLKQKQTIRGQIKEIKSLTARLDEASLLAEELSTNTVEVAEEVEDCTLEEMVEYLKGYRLCVFGGFDAGSLREKFRSYGLDVRHVINDCQFVVGDIDCAIILINNIQHKTVRRLRSQYDGEFVYVSGTSIDGMIKQTYIALNKRGTGN